jgi:hypothetical protein
MKTRNGKECLLPQEKEKNVFYQTQILIRKKKKSVLSFQRSELSRTTFREAQIENFNYFVYNFFFLLIFNIKNMGLDPNSHKKAGSLTTIQIFRIPNTAS